MTYRPRATIKQSIDLGLSVLCAITPQGQTCTLKVIAAYCDCNPNRIRQIEIDALKKIRARAKQLHLKDYWEN